MNKKQLIVEIIVSLFVVLFLYAAGIKLIEYKTFVSQIGMSPLVTRYSGVLAWLVPTTEIVLSVMLMVPRFRGLGLYGSFGLMMMFTLYIIAMFSLDTKLPCACGGVLSNLGWREHLLFNIVFDLLGLAAIMLTYQIFGNKKTGFAGSGTA
jgi:hypothetical protein